MDPGSVPVYQLLDLVFAQHPQQMQHKITANTTRILVFGM